MINFTIFGGTKIGKGPWRPGTKVRSFTILGGIEYDFQQAQLEADVTCVTAFSLLGGTKIIVPAGLPVTVSGLSILGGREVKLSHQGEAAPVQNRALHIKAISILGGTEITDKPAKHD